MDTLLVIPFLALAVNIDGKLDEAVWEQAQTVQVAYSLLPKEGESSPYPAQVWMFHDGTSLYIAARCPAPYGIRTETLQAVTLGLPPFPSTRGYYFAVNAAGALSDAQMIQGDDKTFRWDEDWEAVTHREDTVWTVEMRIPLQPLGFNDALSLQILHRTSLPPDQGYTRLDVWFPVPAVRVNELPLLPIVRLSHQNTPPPLMISFLPYLTLLYTRPFVPLDYQVIQFHRDSLLQYRIGGDFSLKGSNLQIAGAILPDFANVEVDQPEILDDPYALLYLPEKRPFFYEGLDLFSLRLNTLYTRSFVNIRGAVKGEWGGKQRLQGFGILDRDLGFVSGLAWGGDVGGWSPQVGLIYTDTATLEFSSLRYSRSGRSLRLEGARTRRGWAAYAGIGFHLQRDQHESWFSPMRAVYAKTSCFLPFFVRIRERCFEEESTPEFACNGNGKHGRHSSWVPM